MTPFPWYDAAIILGLIALNGLFAMSELAIVSARPARLRLAADRGSKGAAAALDLAADPGKFLSTVQSGVTLTGIIAGAYSGANMGHPLAERLIMLGVPAQRAEDFGFILAVIITTFLSLIIGELVPKQVALRAAEPIAIMAAQPMALLAKITAPFVWVLNRTTNLILRLIGVQPASEPQVTEEELHLIFAEATRSGVLEEEERAIMAGIMRLGDRPVRELMTPRTELAWIERRASEAEIRSRIKNLGHSLVPIGDGSADHIIGVVKLHELQSVLLSGRKPSLTRLMKKPAIIPDQLDAMDAMRLLQKADVAMALVHDEYGQLEGVVTPTDLLTALVGDFVSHREDEDGPMLIEQDDGALIVSGSLPADVLADRLNIELPDDRDYATAAGFVLSVLRHMPQIGEQFSEQDWRFEVVAMDGRRIDRIAITPLTPES